jgi:hypothetical protein
MIYFGLAVAFLIVYEIGWRRGHKYALGWAESVFARFKIRGEG